MPRAPCQPVLLQVFWQVRPAILRHLPRRFESLNSTKTSPSIPLPTKSSPSPENLVQILSQFCNTRQPGAKLLCPASYSFGSYQPQAGVLDTMASSLTIRTANDPKDFSLWDPHKDTFRQLFVADGLSLAAVKAKMESEFGFPTTK